MSWSYDPACSTEKDQVRFLIQDNRSTRQLFQDEEIAWTLTVEQNVFTSAACLCEQLVTRAGGLKSKKISELTMVYDVALYATMAGNLRARGAGHQMPYAGGLTITDKQIQEGDPNATQPSVFRGLDENPAAPQPAISSANPLTTI